MMINCLKYDDKLSGVPTYSFERTVVGAFQLNFYAKLICRGFLWYPLTFCKFPSWGNLLLNTMILITRSVCVSIWMIILIFRLIEGFKIWFYTQRSSIVQSVCLMIYDFIWFLLLYIWRKNLAKNFVVRVSDVNFCCGKLLFLAKKLTFFGSLKHAFIDYNTIITHLLAL